MRSLLFFLSVSFILLSSSSSEGQTLFTFNERGMLTSYPVSLPFDRQGERQIMLQPGALGKPYVHVLKDSLLKLAKQMGSYLSDVHKRETFAHLYGDGSKGYYEEFLCWLTYLENFDAMKATPVFKWFPSIPALNEMDTSAYYLYSWNNKDHILLDASKPSIIDVDEKSPWVQVGYRSSVRWKLVFKDLMKAQLIKTYNQSLPPALLGIGRDELQQQLLPELVRLDSSAERLRIPFKTAIEDSNSILCNASLLSEGRTILARIYSSRLRNIFRTYSDFFLRWQWLGGGQLVFNPWPFTYPNRLPRHLSDNDRMDKLRAHIYDSLYAILRSSDISKVYRDTLTVLDISKQQGKGKERFVLSDSMAEAKKAGETLQAFQKTLTWVYDFSYPYHLPEDSALVVQQFDAGKAYKRVDRSDLDLGPQALKRLRRTNSILPDDEVPAIGVHNLSKNVKLTITESPVAIKDQSAFQALLGDPSGLGAISSLAALFSSSSIAGLGSFLIPTRPTATRAIPNTSAQSLPGAQALQHFTGTRRDTVRARFLVPQQKTVQIDGRNYTLNINERGEIIHCENRMKGIFDTVYLLKYGSRNMACAGDAIKNISNRVIANHVLCTYDAPTFKFWVDSALRAAERIYKTAKSAVQHVSDSLVNAITLIDYISTMKNPIIPPDSLKEEDDLPDSAVFRTSAYYLEKAQSLNNDVFAINASSGKAVDPQKVAAANVKLAPRHFITLGVGPAFTYDKRPVNYVSSSGGQLSIDQDIQSVRSAVGMHIYPLRLFQPDNRFFIHRSYGVSSWSRLSLFLGTGIPHPLENYYTGLSADLVPGLKLHAGAHWLWYTKYNIQNGQVADKASAPAFGGWYIGLNVDPVSAAGALLTAFK